MRPKKIFSSTTTAPVPAPTPAPSSGGPQATPSLPESPGVGLPNSPPGGVTAAAAAALPIPGVAAAATIPFPAPIARDLRSAVSVPGTCADDLNLSPTTALSRSAALPYGGTKKNNDAINSANSADGVIDGGSPRRGMAANGGDKGGQEEVNLTRTGPMGGSGSNSSNDNTPPSARTTPADESSPVMSAVGEGEGGGGRGDRHEDEALATAAAATATRADTGNKRRRVGHDSSSTFTNTRGVSARGRSLGTADQERERGQELERDDVAMVGVGGVDGGVGVALVTATGATGIVSGGVTGGRGVGGVDMPSPSSLRFLGSSSSAGSSVVAAYDDVIDREVKEEEEDEVHTIYSLQYTLNIHYDKSTLLSKPVL